MRKLRAPSSHLLRGLVLLLALSLGQAPSLSAASEDELPERFQGWLEDVALLITEEEKEAFLELREDYQRDEFIEHFWRSRDPDPTTARNEFRQHWEMRTREARVRFGNLREDRARFFLFAGPPDAELEVNCPRVLWPLEIWYYRGTDRVREDFALLFVRHFGVGQYRLWYPSEGLQALTTNPDPHRSPRQLFDQIYRSCRNQDEILQTLTYLLSAGGLEFQDLLARLQRLPGPPEDGWEGHFRHYVTDLPEGAEELAGTLSIDYPGRHQLRTVVEALVEIDAAEAGVEQVGDHRAYNFRVVGDVLQEGKLFETFRYRFDLPADEVATETIPLLFHRHLRPGSYRLVVRVEDVNAGRYFRATEDLEVPERRNVWAADADPESVRLFMEATQHLEGDDDRKVIELMPPRGRMHAGMLRFDTRIASNDVRRVTFSLDEQHVLTKRRPPFSVELDLGRVPKTRTLVATAYDDDGNVLGRDQLVLNPGGHRFAVHLVEPRPGERIRGAFEARADVHAPPQEQIHRVEFFLNDEPAGTHYDEPFVQALEVDNGDLAFVRAVAYLTDGNSTEDVVFFNTPDHFERLDIQFVELYTSVIDRAGRPSLELGKEDFRVLEDGVEQEIVRFDRVDNLPVHLTVALDVSGSMEQDHRLEEAKRAALRFFKEGVTPQDRASLVTFNHHPHLAVDLTNDLDDLSSGLAGVRAEGGTALWDSVIFSLYTLQGIKGQRAVLLLSDGDDVSSRFSFDDTLEFARRTGVAIYSIGLAVGERQARRHLRRLSAETGGRAIFVDTAAELEETYVSILRELRSRYLIAYQSSNAADTREFRRVEVEVRRSGLEALTIRGYYP